MYIYIYAYVCMELSHIEGERVENQRERERAGPK